MKTIEQQNREALEHDIHRQHDRAILWRAVALALGFVLLLLAFLHFTHYTSTGSGWNW